MEPESVASIIHGGYTIMTKIFLNMQTESLQRTFGHDFLDVFDELYKLKKIISNEK